MSQKGNSAAKADADASFDSNENGADLNLKESKRTKERSIEEII